MFALIRFLDDFDKKEYTVPVKDIKDFYLANEQDFSRNKVYTTLWVEEDNPENNGTYPSQVLLQASNRDQWLCNTSLVCAVYITTCILFLEQILL